MNALAELAPLAMLTPPPPVYTPGPNEFHLVPIVDDEGKPIKGQFTREPGLPEAKAAWETQQARTEAPMAKLRVVAAQLDAERQAIETDRAEIDRLRAELAKATKAATKAT